MNPIVNVGVKAARRAGSLMLRYTDRLSQLSVEEKGRNDFVSEVDRMAEADIIDTIQYNFPEHRIVAEESGGELLAGASDEFEWIIDPLDGTTNYLHGHPQFAVSIAVRQKGLIQHAVIFDPLRDELYTASRGQGAQLNNRRIRVSGQGKFGRSLLATGFPFRDLKHYDPWMASFRTILPKVGDIRRCGSAALDLAYVAAGRLDGYWEPGLGSWDIAAGSLLVREAGGLVADYQGDQQYLETGQIVAANSRIFNELMTIVAMKCGKAD